MRIIKNTKISYKTILGTLLSIYIMAVILTYTLPSVKMTVPYLKAGMLMLVFLPVGMLGSRGRLNYGILLIFSSVFVAFIYYLNGIYGLVDTVNEIIRSLRFFMPVLWTKFVLSYCSEKQQRRILIFFAFVTTIIMVVTLTALAVNPMISRILAQDKMSDTGEIRAYRMANVGGFEFSYMVGIIDLCLAWAALKCRNVIWKGLLIAGTVVCYFYIIKTMYMTLLLLTTAGIVLLLAFACDNVVVRIAIICGSIAVGVSLPPLFLFLSNAFKGSLLSMKFLQFYYSLTGGGADSLGSRPDLIADAVERWLKSPILGGYDVSVRTHSTVFSLLEATGLVGLLTFLGCLRASYKTIAWELKRRKVDTRLLSIAFLYVFALATLNPVGYVFEVTIGAFFIVPLWSVLIGEKYP